MQSYVKNHDYLSRAGLLQVLRDDILYRCEVLHGTIAEEGRGARSSRRHPHRHDLYHLILYTAGYGEFLYAGRRWPIRRGALVLGSPGQGHDFKPHGFGHCIYSEVTFQFRASDRRLLDLPFPHLLACLSGSEQVEIESPQQVSESAFDLLDSAFKKTVDGLRLVGPMPDMHSQLLLADLIFTIFCLLLDSLREPDGLARARKHIERHYQENFKIAELARIADLSRGYFMRAFKTEYGITPIHYQQQLRVRAAQNLLRNSNLPCKEIAVRVGFENVYYFSRVFRRWAGKAPAAWRRQ